MTNVRTGFVVLAIALASVGCDKSEVPSDTTNRVFESTNEQVDSEKNLGLRVFRGDVLNINAGWLTTKPGDLWGGKTSGLGFTVRPEDANPAQDFIQIWQRGKHDNSPNPEGAIFTRQWGNSYVSVGFVSIKPIPGGIPVRVTDKSCRVANAVTTSDNHIGCTTQSLGYLLP